MTGEQKAIQSFHDLQMIGPNMARPLEENPVILQSHWQYHLKRDGQQQARQCCDSSKQEALLLRALAKTYSSCGKHPIQQHFLASAAKKNFCLFDCDSNNAFAHSSSPEVPTFMTIDSQYYECYLVDQFKIKLDKSRVLPVLQALQRHPKSGKLWEHHISNILMGSTLNFQHTTLLLYYLSDYFQNHRFYSLNMWMTVLYNVSMKVLLLRFSLSLV